MPPMLRREPSWTERSASVENHMKNPSGPCIDVQCAIQNESHSLFVPRVDKSSNTLKWRAHPARPKATGSRDPERTGRSTPLESKACGQREDNPGFDPGERNAHHIFCYFFSRARIIQ